MESVGVAAWLVGAVGAVAGELVSPNGQYEIEYFEAGPNEANVKLKNAKTGKVLRYVSSSGYGAGSCQLSPDTIRNSAVFLRCGACCAGGL